MPAPSRAELKAAERRLRRDDKALRLRYSLERSSLILIERKTFRGRLGALGPGGLKWRPDAGYRYEWGHVPVASLPAEQFDYLTLRDCLRAADTWRYDKPLWRRVEEADEYARARRRFNRQQDLRYKASEFFDRYVWKYRQRIAVPEQIR